MMKKTSIVKTEADALRSLLQPSQVSIMKTLFGEAKSWPYAIGRMGKGVA